MQIVVFGNSGSGKSTLASILAKKHSLFHLDLDTLAWQKDAETTRLPVAKSISQIDTCITSNPNWIIEGCYSDLLEHITPQASHVIFLDPGVEACKKHCKNRPFESHKYASKTKQDANLSMLLAWVETYYSRSDVCSYDSHKKLFSTCKCSVAHCTDTEYQQVISTIGL